MSQKNPYSVVYLMGGFGNQLFQLCFANNLKKIGHHNFWVNSKAYNIVEMTHHIWLLAVVDLIIGNSEYSA